MLVSFVLPLLASFSFLSCVGAQTASGDAICSASHYAPFGCLTSHTLAASVCSKLPRETLTLTVTTTTLDVNSITLTAHATSQTTVHSTNTQWSTVTVTKGPTQTVTTYETNLKTESKILTTYIPKAHVAALAAPSCMPSKAASSLDSLLPGILATACSCIGHPARTTTVTSTVNAPAKETRTTAFDGRAPTTTIYNIVVATSTITERPTKFVTATKETCITSTQTVSYAAPSFTQAFGPKEGCIDLTSDSGKILPQSVKNLHDAAQECKSLCSQDSSCEAVYIQYMSHMRNFADHYHCFFNSKKLEKADFKCFPMTKTSIYGKAIGYDACGRGTEEL